MARNNGRIIAKQKQEQCYGHGERAVGYVICLRLRIFIADLGISGLISFDLFTAA